MLLTLPIREVLPATPRARIVRLDLGGRRFPYEPGQAVKVAFPGNLRRTFSIAGAPDDARRDDCLELLVGVDGHSRELQHALRPGSRLDVEGPIGDFIFDADQRERRFAFIAAGTGIAPLRSMLRHALLDSRRKIVVVYSARTPAEFAYHNELRSLARHGRIELRQSITRHHPADEWTEGRGRIGREHVQQIVRNCAPVCFICGPSMFVNQTKRLLLEAGLPQDRVRIEDWVAAQSAAPARLAQSRLSGPAASADACA
jgi:ferredoxin-NADP reductase